LDNAVAEFFFKSLKTELVYGSELISRGQMEPEIFGSSHSRQLKHCIEIWQNKKEGIHLWAINN
jgi:putative transposase